VSRPVRAIVYGVGAMGAIMARLLLEKGVEIVGAVARSPAKVGRDLGEVAGLDRTTGVLVEPDARPALERGADVALVAVSSYLHVMAHHFRLCLEHGTNVVTIEEETVWPWHTAPELAAELDATARANGVSIAASGAQDVFWMKLVATLMGAAHRIEEVTGYCSWNADDYGPEVAAHVHLGESPEAFARHLEEHGWPDFVARANLEALVADAGLTVAEVESGVEPVLAEEDTPSASLGRPVRRGHLLGILDTTTVRTAEGPTFSFAMAGRVYRAGEADVNEWTIRGEPDLHLRNDRVPTRLITCTSVVNRIPDVIAAEPGLVTLDRLPQPRYRHGALTLPS
jgi:4-hydroxy-tetrahydrodipicolinate reductase